MKRLLTLAALLVALFLPLRAMAADPATAEGILSFADALLKDGETFRAATEYKRALHHFGGEREAKRRALEGLAASYNGAGRFDDAAAPLSTLVEEYPEGNYRGNLGRTLYRAGRNVEAADLLLGPSPTPDEALLGTLAWLKTGATGPIPANADQPTVRAFGELPEKSPTTAGILSALLPGAGHLYVERPHDALVAFVLNGLFIWGTAEAVQNRDWALAGVLGTVELFWYSGTVVGSVNGAYKWNERERQRFFETREPKNKGFSLRPSQGGGLLAYTLIW